MRGVAKEKLHYLSPLLLVKRTSDPSTSMAAAAWGGNLCPISAIQASFGWVPHAYTKPKAAACKAD